LNESFEKKKNGGCGGGEGAIDFGVLTVL